MQTIGGLGQPVDVLAPARPAGLDARAGTAAEARRSLRRVGRSRRRARSYLQTNCAHCHQFNAGGTATIELGFDVPLEQTRTVDVRPIQGTFQIAGPGSSRRRSIALGAVLPRLQARRRPDAPHRLGRGRCARSPHAPRLDRRDARPKPGTAAEARGDPREDRTRSRRCSAGDRLAASDRTAAIRRLASSTRGALMLLDLVDRGRSPASRSREAAAIARQEPRRRGPRPVRAVHPRERASQAVGRHRRPAAILALAGEAHRGRAVFATIPPRSARPATSGRRRARKSGRTSRRSVRSTTRPRCSTRSSSRRRRSSRRTSRTWWRRKDGRVLSGLMVEEDERRGGDQGREGQDDQGPEGGDRADRSTVAVTDAGKLLLRDLTAQQVADLLEFLASLR